KKYIIGIDTGGTFTDSVVVDGEGNIYEGKALTNYKDFKEGVIASIEDAVAKMDMSIKDVLSKTIFLGHGTTLGTNAVINRIFGKAGLITTKGHEDVTLIMRAAKTDGLGEAEVRHQATIRKPQPLIPKNLIKGVVERVDCFGRVVIPLDLNQTEEVIDELVEDGVEAIAICLFWSFANLSHERLIKDLILEKYPDIYVSVSSEVAPQIREYARSMTVAIDAVIGKLMRRYINSLNEELMQRGLKYPISIMHAYGGVTSSSTARPVGTIESGPVGGVIGSRYLAEKLGYKDVITSDVGGTSFDVSVLKNGEWTFAKEPIMMRFRVAIPIIKITCIGAGGGTICWIDPLTDRLKVGPESAGSHPGPVCYGFGGKNPTVTDADLILGYLNPDNFFEGKMKLNKEAAYLSIKEQIADPLGMEPEQAAAGIYDIVNSYMADNLRQSVIEKGYDPRDFILFAYGGNGPMHAGVYSKEIGVKKAVIPPQSSVFSAFGIASSDVMHIYKQSELLSMPADPDKVTSTFNNLEEKAVLDMEREGFKKSDVILNRELDMRYGRQVHEVGVFVKGGILTHKDIEQISNDWEARYDEIYGKGAGFKEAGILIVSFKVTAICRTFKPEIRRQDMTKSKNSDVALKGTRKAFFRKYNDFCETKIYDFKKLQFGNEISGPAIIEAPTTTIVIHPENLASVDEYRNVILE
ncbi:MAG: hydantoinase/oxoprolinase family protein, partial [Thermodesulfobacteriota bacterium]|nr:hydantoinase/oxoprolinase family protein [Thermodesulfobacteriota bacterium]